MGLLKNDFYPRGGDWDRKLVYYILAVHCSYKLRSCLILRGEISTVGQGYT